MLLTVAVNALRWAFGFVARHFVLVIGISLVPAAQRLLITWPDLEIPAWLSIASEVVAEGSRFVLVVAALTIMVRETFGERLDLSQAWSRFTAGIDRDLPAFLGQFAFLAIAFLVFDFAPRQAIDTWVHPDNRDVVTSIVVAVKNPTVIAMTFLWLVGVAREFMLAASTDAADTTDATDAVHSPSDEPPRRRRRVHA